MGPVARILPDGQRLHLQHGPSDLIVFAEGDRACAYDAAIARFETIIAEVVAELPALRGRVSSSTPPPERAVARRMHDATVPFFSGQYLTRMAAVAGAIADEVLVAMMNAAPLDRAYVNNGGDIALHLAPGQTFRTAMKGHDGRDLGEIEIAAQDKVRGIATSGRHGRSLSMGIADSVTVLSCCAARADVAATLIANAVDIADHPAIARRPAHDVVDDSDLGDLPVVTACGPLDATACSAALAKGRLLAERFQSQGLIAGAGLFLQDAASTTNNQLTLHSKEAQYA